MNKYVISIRMRDRDIPEDNATVVIHTLPQRSLNDVIFDIKKAFKDYDSNEGNAKPYREEGWGLESFVDYLKFRYSGTMTFSVDYPDEFVELVGN